MKSLIDNSLQPAAIYNRKREQFVECNQPLAELFGYDTENEWLALSLLDYFHEDQFNGHTPGETLAGIYEHFEKNDVHFTSIVGVKKDRSKFIIELFAIKNYLSYGSGTVFFFKEIDKQYLSNKVTLDNNLIYQTIVNSSFDFIDIIGVKILDINAFSYEAKMLDRNENMKEKLGLTNETFINKEEIQKFTPKEFWEENAPNFYNIVLTLREKGTASFNWHFIRKDGQIIYLSVGLYTIRFTNQIILVRIMRDITKNVETEILIKEQNASLRKKNKELEDYIESNTQLQNFAQIASHDMKAPLRTITSFSQILQTKIKDKLSEQEKELFDYIIKGSQNLTKLVDDLLNFSKISEQKIEIETFETAALLSNLKRDLTAIIEDSKVNISIEDTIPQTITADYTKTKRVFQNIIQNAIKFSKEGIQPKIEINGKEDEKFWHFSIKDNGIGIREEQINNVFKMFRRLNGHNYAGSGMGMALCQKIVEQHKGSIWVESEFGEGSTFHFNLNKKFIS